MHKVHLEGVRGLFRGEWPVFPIVSAHGPTALTERKPVLRSNSSGSWPKLLPPLFTATNSVHSVPGAFQPAPPTVGEERKGSDKLLLLQIMPQIIQFIEAP
jgi:hypothetical protein